MKDVIRAPWTPAQVSTLNEFQRRGGMHPFTCGREHGSPSPTLVAKTDGWHCPGTSHTTCDYRQDWAHAFMADRLKWFGSFPPKRAADETANRIIYDASNLGGAFLVDSSKVSAVQIARPPVISITGNDGRLLAAIHPDGRLEYGEDYRPDEAAQAFWEAVQRLQQALAGGDARQAAYDAVFAYIRSQPRDFLPTTIVDRNAMIWHAVHAALDAMGVPAADQPKED